jgi:hypothetical protein
MINNAGIMIGGTIQLMALSLSGFAVFHLTSAEEKSGTPLISLPRAGVELWAVKSERSSAREPKAFPS